MATPRHPRSSTPAALTWIRSPPSSGTTTGTSISNSSKRPQPASPPTNRAISTNAAPGTTTRPETEWSSSQECVATDRRPTALSPPVPGSSTTAPSSPCPASPSPRSRGRPSLCPLSQYRCRWKAYVGNSTRRGRSPYTPSHRTEPPRTATPASAVNAARTSSRPRRITGSQTSPPPGSPTCGPSPDKTPSGPTSTNVRTPASRSPATASPNRTAARTCRTQYPGSVTSSATSPPVRPETKPTRGFRNCVEATTRPNSSSIGSINGE